MASNAPGSGSRPTEKEIFFAALEQPAAARAAYVDAACRADPELRRRVDALFANHLEGDSFMAGPVLAVTPGEPATPTIFALPSEQSGDRIGRYKLLQKIGEGGCGIVYMAEQEEPVRRRVALKIIKPGFETKDVIARFEAERQALAMMNHPNIARFFDAGIIGECRVESAEGKVDSALLTPHSSLGSRPYFVMELVPGVRLTDYCDQHRLDLRQRLELFDQVCAAIQHAHQKSIIHRDIKPSNVLVTINDGVPVPKIIDFGIAKATEQRLTDKTLFTQFAQLIGTPAYMSPEQATLTNLDIDTRADIYSLGVLLYELLTGHLPFDTRELLKVGLDELCRNLRNVEPLRPSTKVSTLPPGDGETAARARGTALPELRSRLRGDLDWVVMKALEKDRTRRYATAGDLAADLRRYLSDEPVTARAPSFGYRFEKFARRNRIALAAAGLVTGSLIAATGLSLWQARVARLAEASAVAARKDAEARMAAEKAAREESDAFASFLTWAFQSADPKQKHGDRTTTVAQVLDRAVQRLDIDLAKAPARQVRIRATLGATYQSLGLYAQAIPLLEKALDYYAIRFGQEHKDTLHAKGNLANCYHRAGRHREGLQLTQEVLETHQRVSGPEHPDTLLAMNNLAGAYYETGRHSEALALREKVLPIRRRVSGPENPDTLLAMANLAISYKDGARRDDAVRLMEETLSLRRKVNGTNNPDTLDALNNLGLIYSDVGRHKESVQLMEESVAISRTVLGPEHPETLDSMNNLALLYSSAGRRAEALELREEILPLRSKVLGPDHTSTLWSIQNLASSYYDADRHHDALQLREESLPRFQQVFGTNHLHTLRAMANLANSYSALGRQADALRWRERVLDLSRASREPEDPTTIDAMAALAQSYFDAERRQEAVDLQERVVAFRDTFSGPEHRTTIEALYNLAKYYAGVGKPQEALALKEKVLTLMRKTQGPEHPNTIRAMMGLAIGYRDVGRTNEAVTLGRTNLVMFQRIMGPKHTRTLYAATSLAISLRAAGSLSEAIPLETATLAAKREAFPAGHPAIVESIENLVACCEAAGRKAEADGWRAELATVKAASSSQK